MKRHFYIILPLLILITPLVVQAQALLSEPSPDPYEPDEADPPWIGNDEIQERSFYPEGDVDKARFRVKAGY